MSKEDLYCHYSDLPSPAAYKKDDIDYDGMGNQGRFPKTKHKRKDRKMKRLIAKIKSIWKLCIGNENSK